MKLDNVDIKNVENNDFPNKFDPDKMLDNSSIELFDKTETVIKITEKTNYNPDAMLDNKDVGNGKINKELGCKREEEVAKDLNKMYPEEEYKILQERTLKNRQGESVKDADGSKRRVDFVIVKDKEVVDMVEVTSLTASKTDQMRKEYNIRDNGGNYIKDPDTGELYKIPDNVNTRIERRA